MKCECGNEAVAVRGRKGNVDRCDRCNREASLSETLSALSVARVFHDSRLSDFKTKFDTDKSLFLCGPVGCGKTHLAVALLVEDILSLPVNRRIESHVAFTSMVNLLARIRATFSKTAKETEEELVRYFSSVPNLYIDDIGVEQATDWSRTCVYRIIDHRWGNKLRTVFTSNFDLDELGGKLGIEGDRIVSRIQGMSKVVQLNGKDRRNK